MDRGFVKLWRKLLDSEVFANEGLLKVWVYCMCKSNHKKRFVPFKTGRSVDTIEVKPGQFIYGRNKAAEHLHMSPSTVYKRMKKLVDLGCCNIKSNTHYSIITICNWDTYQGSEIPKEQAKEQPSNRQVTGKEQASNTNKNEENDKNVKNVKKKRNIIPPKIEWIKKYCIVRGNNIDPERFFDHYEGNGWFRGKTKMKDWQATVRTWEKGDNKKSTQSKGDLIKERYRLALLEDRENEQR